MSRLFYHAQNRLGAGAGAISLPFGAQAFYNFADTTALVGGVNLTLGTNATTQTTGGVTFVQRSAADGTANVGATVGNLTAPRDPFALGGTSFTIAARVRWSAFDNFSSLFFKHGAGGNYDYTIYTNSGRIAVGGSNNNTEAFITGSIPTNTWAMIVWRHPNTLANNRVTLRHGGTNTTNTISIGGLPTNNYTGVNIGTYFAQQGSLCDIDWFGVWHRELSDTELDTLWNSGNTGTFASLAFPRSGGFDMLGATSSGEGWTKTINSQTYFVQLVTTAGVRSEGGGEPAWEAFRLNESESSNWTGAWATPTSAGVEHRLELHLPVAQTFTGVSVRPSSNTLDQISYPADWRFSGSNDGISWTTLLESLTPNYTASNWTRNVYRNFTFSTTGSFTRYRFTSWNTGYNNGAYPHRIFGSVIYS